MTNLPETPAEPCCPADDIAVLEPVVSLSDSSEKILIVPKRTVKVEGKCSKELSDAVFEALNEERKQDRANDAAPKVRLLITLDDALGTSYRHFRSEYFEF